ncbi:uncharacterized protein [Nicotiana tomentosiformis]|uniref:uncharacterized protein n=1 Tax=Nicotiana tomentosiformis TaxID=4098 RepID=UPI00388CA885
MATTTVEFFKNQFTQESDTTCFELLNNVPSMVTTDYNLELCRYPTLEEVKKAVFALSGDSASGVDGFTGLFHQKCWDIVGADIFMMVKAVYRGASLPKSITHTNLVLLPKKPQVQTFSDLRPTVLVILSARSYPWYYTIEWRSRGVKQGDPLSPALFILSAEVLSRSLNKLFLDRNFIGFGMSKWTDPLNHLSYADDTIIFSSADPYSLQKVMEVLTKYEQIYGQLINKSKSSYYMHTKVGRNLSDSVGSITSFQKGSFLFTNLGCPMLYTRIRKDYYNDLTSKVEAKLHSYKGKLLYIGGKATLITSVLQSLPTHILSVLDPPDNVLEHLHKMFARFFWSTNEERRSRHWTKWLNLCLPKKEGELDFNIKEELHEVAQLRIENGWDDLLLHHTFLEDIAYHIKQVICFDDTDAKWDTPKLMPTTSGKFTWTNKIKFFEAYKPIIITKRVTWQMPDARWFKCNTDGDSRGNQRLSSYEFCVRDSTGDVIFVKAEQIGVSTSLVTEAKALMEGILYYFQNQLHPMIIKTNSLVLKTITEGQWAVPWSINKELKKINKIKGQFNVILQHVFREGNAVADFLANLVFSFAGTLEFKSFYDFPVAARSLINYDKSQIPNLRIRVARNRGSVP